MDQSVTTTIALIESSILSPVDKEYFVAALKRNGLTETLEKEIQTALKTAAVTQQTKSDFAPDDSTAAINAAEDALITLENERERRTQELDDKFAPRFQALDTQMAALQKEYDDALAVLNTEIDQKIDQSTASL